MDPPNPTTPDRRFARTKHVLTPNRLATTFATSSQPVGSTQRALQAPLTGSAIFANEAIVGAVFQPSKVKDQTVKDILAEIDDDPSLKAARSAVLHGKLAETKKYGPLLTLFEHITTYVYQEVPLRNNDYARHVRRHWVDTHGQRINTDPGIYLPEEVAAKELSEDSNSDYEHIEATVRKKGRR